MFYSTNFGIWKTLCIAGAILLSIFLRVLFPILGLIILVALDMRFGIKKYVQNEKREGRLLKSEKLHKNIKSGGFRKTLAKSADYVIFIIAFMVLEAIMENMGVNIKYENFSLSTLVVLLLCVTEVKSLDENFEEIYGVKILTSVLDFVFKRKSVSEIITNRDNEIKA